MEILDDIINKVGMDKVLHFAFGGWIISLISILGLKTMIIALIILLIISIIKEYCLDNYPDLYDVLAGILGASISFIIYFILTII